MKILITKKEGMTRIHKENGTILPVTILSAFATKKVGDKTLEKDGYIASIVEANGKNYELLGTECDTSIDDLENQSITLAGTTKGKGFTGTIKRFGFSRGPMSHGSHNKRKPGAAGSAYPQRVTKGQQMPGRVGGLKTTIKTKVEGIIKDKNYILVKGSVPGRRGSLIIVKTVK